MAPFLPAIANKPVATNETAGIIINNFGNSGGFPAGGGMDIPPLFAFAPSPCCDQFGNGSQGINFGVGNELGDFGNSKMGSKLGDASIINSLLGGISSIISATSLFNLGRA